MDRSGQLTLANGFHLIPGRVRIPTPHHRQLRDGIAFIEVGDAFVLRRPKLAAHHFACDDFCELDRLCMLLQGKVGDNKLSFRWVLRQQNVTEAHLRQVLDLERLDQQTIERQLPIGPNPIRSHVGFFRLAGMVPCFIVPYRKSAVPLVVVDAINTTVHDHRLAVYVEGDPVRLFDFVLDVLDPPTICDLSCLMFRKSLKSPNRLLQLNLQCGRGFDTKLFPCDGLEVFREPVCGLLCIGRCSHRRLDQVLEANVQEIAKSTAIELEPIVFKRSNFFDPIQIKPIRALIVFFKIRDRHVADDFARVRQWNWDVRLNRAGHPGVCDELIVCRLFWRKQQLHTPREQIRGNR